MIKQRLQVNEDDLKLYAMILCIDAAAYLHLRWNHLVWRDSIVWNYISK